MADVSSTLQVDIADVSRLVFSGSCLSITVPAALGELCILARHAPLLTTLLPGVVRLRIDDDNVKTFYLSGGFLEVKDSLVTVLADQMLRSDEIDREAALTAKQEAEQVFKRSRVSSERDRARIDLTKALARLRALEIAEGERLKKHRR